MRIPYPLLAALALLLAPASSAQTRAGAAPADGAADVAADAASESPALLTYSGVLTSADGTPLPDGAHRLVFRGYASAGAADAVWEEAHDATVTAGQFWVMLGVKAPLAEAAEWYTVSVDGAPESRAVRLSGESGGGGAAGLAPGNTMDDSYENGQVVNVDQGRPIIFRGAPGSFYTGLQIKDITAVFSNEELLRFRMRSVQGGATWEHRVYGSLGANAGAIPPGSFAVSNASSPGAKDSFIIFPTASEDLLRLDGNAVRVGSASSQTQLAVYTTENAANPALTNATLTMYDHFGYGAGTSWFEDDGNEYAAMQPDIDGDGGFLRVENGTGGVAFQVDGNAGTGSTVTIGAGSGQTTFDTDATASSTVLLPSNAVDATEVLNEGGVANAINGSPIAMASGFNVTLVRTITAPTAGYVYAHGQVELQVSHASGTTDVFQVSVSRDCATPTVPTSQQSNWFVPSVLPSTTYLDTKSIQGLFSVPAGSTTFCIVVSAPPATSFVDDQQLTLLFVPTAYGGITSNVGEGGDEQAETPMPALTAADVQAERAASIQSNEGRVQDELQEIRQRLAEIQEQMGNDRQ